MASLFSSITPQNLHLSFSLAKEGHEEDAKQFLNYSFEHTNLDTAYLSDQFISWSVNKTDQMDIEDAFNESAFHLVNKNRQAAVKALEKKLAYYDLDANEFAQSFVDWGLALIKLNETINKDL